MTGMNDEVIALLEEIRDLHKAFLGGQRQAIA